MLGEIPYMMVWGFFSALGWMTANWVVEKNFPDKQQEKPPIIEKQVEDKNGRNIEVSGQKRN